MSYGREASIKLAMDAWSAGLDCYDQGDYAGARKKFEESMPDCNRKGQQDCLFNIAICVASQGDYAETINLLDEADPVSADSLYSSALCHYKLTEYEETLRLTDQLLSNWYTLHPELRIGNRSITRSSSSEEFKDMKSSIYDLMIVECLNLRWSTLFKLNRDQTEAKCCLDRLPFKSEKDFDSVSLHNKSICEHEIDSISSIDKLQYLIQLFKRRRNDLELSGLPLKDVYTNLITISMVTGNNDALENQIRMDSKDIEENVGTTLFQYFSICCDQFSGISDDVIYSKLSNLSDQLMRTQQREIDLLLTVTMHQGLILWTHNQFDSLERLLSKVEPLLGESDIWKINMAHTLYMLDTRYEDCSRLYEKLVRESKSLTEIDSSVLGNLCVSYVLTGRNGDAEALIKDVETSYSELQSSTHDELNALSATSETEEDVALCTINLVIGTLYCVKNNYDFGLTRLIKTLSPLEQKLTSNTWYFVKRCILSMIDTHCKQMIYIKDDLFEKILSFLVQCERIGRNISKEPLTEITGRLNKGTEIPLPEIRSVSFEARYLRWLVLKVVHD